MWADCCKTGFDLFFSGVIVPLSLVLGVFGEKRRTLVGGDPKRLQLSAQWIRLSCIARPRPVCVCVCVRE